jgi:hypothetical protein
MTRANANWKNGVKCMCASPDSRRRIGSRYKKGAELKPSACSLLRVCLYWLTPSIARMRKLEATLLPSFFSRSA